MERAYFLCYNLFIEQSITPSCGVGHSILKGQLVIELPLFFKFLLSFCCPAPASAADITALMTPITGIFYSSSRK